MPDDVDNWADELKNIIPDINVKVCKSRNDALKEIVDADVVYGEVEKELLESFICPIVRIDENTKLESIPKRRRRNEELYISTKALNGNPLEIGGVDLILYRFDVLNETNERETNEYWELIAFHAIPKEFDSLPMGPVTMMRNQLELSGGTKGNYSPEEWAKGVYFWQQYALLK